MLPIVVHYYKVIQDVSDFPTNINIYKLIFLFMKYLINIIDTTNETNIIEEIMSKEKPKQIEVAEWLYKGCFIQEFKHPKLVGKYTVFKNNEQQTHIDRCHTFTEAKILCEKNKCFDNFLEF